MLRVDGLGKRYALAQHPRLLVHELLLKPFRRTRREDLWALRGLSFELGRGQTLGVIGANGSGKSTLLRLLAEVSEPSEGTVEVDGRIGALIELGAGLHPALTGRENVFLNGAVLGLGRAEIGERYPAIVEFAELAPFMDTPVRGWSAGMLTRLGFAVAVHTNPEILLIDEVLAVGDEQFQRKSLAAVRDLQLQGVTTVFVSHNLGLVKRVADRVLVLERGRAVAIEEPRIAVGIYLAGLGSLAGEARERGLLRARSGRYGGETVAIEEVRLTDEHGQARTAFVHGGTLRIELRYAAREPVEEARASVAVWSAGEDVVVYAVNTAMDGIPLRLDRSGTLVVTFPRLQLLRGRYELTVTLRRGADQVLDQHDRCHAFEVLADRDDLGLVHLDHRWEA